MVRSCLVPRYGSEAPIADEFYGQRDVMRMPEPEEFRQLCQRRATPIWTKGVLLVCIEHLCFV